MKGKCLGGMLAAGLLCAAPGLRGQVSRDKVVELNAVVQTNTPVITLQWNAVAASTNVVYRRLKGASSWSSLVVTQDIAATSFADSNAVAGVTYEYMVRRTRSSAPTYAYGTIVAGCNVPLVDDRGRVVLIVDQSLNLSLGPEIERLQSDLAGDGWSVVATNVPRMVVDPASTNATDYTTRTSELAAVRAIVQAEYAADTNRTRTVFLLGRLPVPYSGSIAPDGHGDHIGAWPTDSFYGDVNGSWNDASITSNGGADRRNWNVPGDGKFDHGTIPSDIELAVGRVDLANMNSVPLGVTEVPHLRQYLNRDHAFRHARAPYDDVPRRALIDDGFGYFGGEAFAASGWRNGLTFFGRSAGAVNPLDWFSTLQTDEYLLGYGCGGGSYTSANGIGTSTYDFAQKHSKAAFTMLFGSYFGDWDIANNFLRSPLAGTAESLGLTCAWSGRGYFHFDHMAMGETVGFGHWITQNNPVSLASGGWEGNGSARGIQHNLMGDPTLRLHTVPPPLRPAAQVSAGQVALSWQAPGDPTVTRYHVYRGASPAGPFVRLTGGAATAGDPMGSPIAATSYTDTTVAAGTAYTYLIKSIRVESSPSGTYANSSQGAAVTTIADPVTAGPSAPTGLVVSGQGGGVFLLSWEDNSGDETGFEIQRRDPSTGAWSTIATPGGGSTNHTDNTAPDNQVVHYRVRAVGASGNSAYCLAAADGNSRGLAKMFPDAFLTDKSVGTANVPALRWNGSQGRVGVSYSITNITATNGVHYTAVNGSLVWTNGESGVKPVPVPIANLPGPQLTRVFRVNLHSPTGGVVFTSFATNYVFVGDASSQSLPEPWTDGIVGALMTTGYVEYADGGFGALCRSGDIETTADTFRYIHRTAAADMRLTCRVTALPSTSASTAKAGIMVRADMNGASACFANVIEAGRTARRIYRSSGGGTADAGTLQGSLAFPCWLRVLRTNDMCSAHWSTNGSAWNALGSGLSLPNLGTSPVIGMAVASDNATGADIPACGSFDSVNFEIAPAAPSSVSAAYGRNGGEILLGWWTVADATSYRIERALAAGGPFSQIATVGSGSSLYTDPGLDPLVTYYYRMRSEGNGLVGLYSDVVSSKPLPSGIAAWRLQYFGTVDNSGPGADNADPDIDGRINLEEYAFVSHPKMRTTTKALREQLVPGAGLAVEFNRDRAHTDLDVFIEASDDMLTWHTVAQSLAGAVTVSVDGGWTVSESGSSPVLVRVSQTASAPPEFVRLRAVRK